MACIIVTVYYAVRWKFRITHLIQKRQISVSIATMKVTLARDLIIKPIKIKRHTSVYTLPVLSDFNYFTRLYILFQYPLYKKINITLDFKLFFVNIFT